MSDFYKIERLDKETAALKARVAELEAENARLRLANIECKEWFDNLKVDYDGLREAAETMESIVCKARGTLQICTDKPVSDLARSKLMNAITAWRNATKE